MIAREGILVVGEREGANAGIKQQLFAYLVVQMIDGIDEDVLFLVQCQVQTQIGTDVVARLIESTYKENMQLNYAFNISWICL